MERSQRSRRQQNCGARVRREESSEIEENGSMKESCSEWEYAWDPREYIAFIPGNSPIFKKTSRYLRKRE